MGQAGRGERGDTDRGPDGDKIWKSRSFTPGKSLEFRYQTSSMSLSLKLHRGSGLAREVEAASYLPCQVPRACSVTEFEM